MFRFATRCKSRLNGWKNDVSELLLIWVRWQRQRTTKVRPRSRLTAGAVCRLASTDMPAIVGGEDPVAFAALEVAIGAAILFEEVASLPLRRLIAEPRAPPLFS